MKKAMQAVLIFILFVFVAGIGAGCGSDAGKKAEDQSKQAEQYLIRFAGSLPANHHISLAQERFKKIVEEKSNGKVQVQVYPAGQLYSDKDMVDVVPRGGVELAVINWGMWTGLVPELNISGLVPLYSDTGHWLRVFADDTEIRKFFADALEKKGNAKFLGWLDYGESCLLSKKPVKTMQDFKGMKIRAFTETQNYFLQGVGASPALISSGEMYQGLQRGVIDGVLSGPTSFIQRKLTEVAKNVTKFNLQYAVFTMVANLDYWNKLPKEIQQIILEAAQETEKWCREETKKEDEKAWKTLEQMPDIKIHPLTGEEIKKWRDAGLPLQVEKFSKSLGDPKVVEHLLEVVEKYR